MPCGPAGLVEVEDPVHVPVVGDPDRRLAVGHGGSDDLGDPGRAVEHRVLGVHVQVGEAGSGHGFGGVIHTRPTGQSTAPVDEFHGV